MEDFLPVFLCLGILGFASNSATLIYILNAFVIRTHVFTLLFIDVLFSTSCCLISFTFDLLIFTKLSEIRDQFDKTATVTFTISLTSFQIEFCCRRMFRYLNFACFKDSFVQEPFLLPRTTSNNFFNKAVTKKSNSNFLISSTFL